MPAIPNRASRVQNAAENISCRAAAQRRFDIRPCGREIVAARRRINNNGERMRTMTLLLCLALGAPLAGCATASATNEAPAMATPEPAVTAVPPAVPGRGQPRPPKQQEAKQTDKKEEWWKEGGVTREKINAMCWMKYENGRKDLPIEKRADLVNACVAETLKEHPL
jgi:hypothetical protein